MLMEIEAIKDNQVMPEPQEEPDNPDQLDPPVPRDQLDLLVLLDKPDPRAVLECGGPLEGRVHLVIKDNKDPEDQQVVLVYRVLQEI